MWHTVVQPIWFCACPACRALCKCGKQIACELAATLLPALVAQERRCVNIACATDELVAAAESRQ